MRLLLCLIFAMLSGAVAPVRSAPALTQSSGQATDAQIYEKFRAWISVQPPDAHQSPDLVEDRYRKFLAAEGLTPSEIDRHIRVIDEQGQKLEIERWNRILTSPKPMFNTKPNAFLVEMTRAVAPGTALDVGMGQGRNALYLAQQGWTVTGFDPADKAVDVAQAEAKRLGVKLTALVQRDDQFDFGNQQWDLIVLSYVGARGLVSRVHDSLKPGGLVVLEAFHRDAQKAGPIGGAVVFDTNELLKLFDRFRILRYEDTDGTGDFGLASTRLVRLCAQRP
jgi:SAM-dependent methyltransferase